MKQTLTLKTAVIFFACLSRGIAELGPITIASYNPPTAS